MGSWQIRLSGPETFAICRTDNNNRPISQFSLRPSKLGLLVGNELVRAAIRAGGNWISVEEERASRNLEDASRFLSAERQAEIPPAPFVTGPPATKPSSLGEPDLRRLIGAGETKFVEFKESLRVDVKNGTPSKIIEHAVMKSMAGFLNGDGGVLLIGVRDDGRVAGLQPDYASFEGANKRDEWAKHFDNLVRSKMVAYAWNNFTVSWSTTADGDVVSIAVESSSQPVFLESLKPPVEKVLYVRMAAGTVPLTVEQAVYYSLRRWGEKQLHD